MLFNPTKCTVCILNNKIQKTIKQQLIETLDALESNLGKETICIQRKWFDPVQCEQINEEHIVEMVGRP